jgi:dephospho-CoA kinase
MIIGLVGEKLAGKDTAANYLMQNYGADHFRFTHILDAILEELNLPISRQNEIDLGLGLRKIFGEHVLANAMEQRVRKSWAGFCVVNGIRMDELEMVRSWGPAKIIYITAPLQTRYERYKKRSEKADDAQMNLQQFTEQEKSPTEVAIPSLGEKADYKIENTGSMDEFYKKIDNIAAPLFKGHVTT